MRQAEAMTYVRFCLSAEQAESLLLCGNFHRSCQQTLLRLDVYDKGKGIATRRYWYFISLFTPKYDIGVYPDHGTLVALRP